MTTLMLNEGECYCHHMPDGACCYPDLQHGMTVRDVLVALREATWGDMGGTDDLHLSDGTYLCVELRPAWGGGGHLLNSQRVKRYRLDSGREETIRYYSL